MRFYELLSAAPGAELWEGTHTWRLPRVEDCPRCGTTWISMGIAYPQIDLSGREYEGRLRQLSLGSFDEWIGMRDLLRSTLPADVILEPGTAFGPLHAQLRGKAADLLIDPSTNALLANSQAAALLKPEVDAVVKAEIQTRAGERLNYFELALPYIAEIASSGFERLDPQCSTCRYQRADLGKSLRLSKASLPPDRHIFRAQNWPTMILATDKIKDLVEGSGLTGLLFRDAQISDNP